MKKAKLTFEDGVKLEGKSFGADKSVSGEVVFATGMVGYPEALTDPSFRGQILVLTYPIIGSYGVPKKEDWESDKIQVAGLIVCDYIDTPSHHAKERTLGEWFRDEGVPLVEIKDTRFLAKKLRSKGVLLGKLEIGNQKIKKLDDPNLRNLVAEVSTKEIKKLGKGDKNIILIDCGTKRNIARRLVNKGFHVTIVPWNTDVSSLDMSYDAVVISNGPGDPTKAEVTISNIKKLMKNKVPIFGICLGNQLLTLAGGGKTYKLKFGHRSQNQPVVEVGKTRSYLTTQNHGFAVGKVPKGFKEWFYNANDETNEGIIHESLPFMSVQFHPEDTPGPTDTDWVFDYFLKKTKLL